MIAQASFNELNKKKLSKIFNFSKLKSINSVGWIILFGGKLIFIYWTIS